jgi:hypothetical protein
MLPPAAGTESTVIGGTHEHIQQWGRIAPTGAEKGAAQHALAHPARLRLGPSAPDSDAQRAGHRPGGSATSGTRAGPGHLRDPDLTTRQTEEDAQWPVGSLRVFTPTTDSGQELNRAGSTDHTTSDGETAHRPSDADSITAPNEQYARPRSRAHIRPPTIPNRQGARALKRQSRSVTIVGRGPRARFAGMRG